MSSVQQILHSVPSFRFSSFSQSILISVQNDNWTVRRHSKRQQRICYSVKERDSNGKNRDWVSLLVYKEVAGEAGRRILAWGNDAKEQNEDSFSAPVLNDDGRQGVITELSVNVILNECEGSIPAVRKTVRCHQHNRFFTLCHCSVFFPHSVLIPVQNDRGWQGVIVRETLSVIRSECEGSAPVVKKLIKWHSGAEYKIE